MTGTDEIVILLLQADAGAIPLPDNSVHCCVCSPPYWGLRRYEGLNGKEQLGLEPTPEQYVANLVVIFREVRRVLRNDGTLWLNLGDSYAANRGSGAKSVGDKQASNIGSLLGALRVPVGLKEKDLCGIPWRVAFALQADGWWLRSDIIWSKPNPMPESVRDRPTKAHEYLFLLTKAARYYYDQDAIREPHSRNWQGESALIGMSEWAELAGRNDRNRAAPPQLNPAGRNKRSVWEIPTQPFPAAHFATYPEALVEPCILAGSPYGGLVLDPFVGSGTTCQVACRLGRRSIGLDLSKPYLRLAQDRTAEVQIGLPI